MPTAIMLPSVRRGTGASRPTDSSAGATAVWRAAVPVVVARMYTPCATRGKSGPRDAQLTNRKSRETALRERIAVNDEGVLTLPQVGQGSELFRRAELPVF